MKINLVLANEKHNCFPPCTKGIRKLETNITDEEKNMLCEWLKEIIRDSHGKPSDFDWYKSDFPNGLEGFYPIFTHIAYGEWRVWCTVCRWSEN